MSSGNLRKQSKARRAPHPEQRPTNPAERVGEGSNAGMLAFDDWIFGVMVASAETKGAISGRSRADVEIPEALSP